MVQPTEDLARKHYGDLKDKPFFNGLIKYFSSNGPVVAMVWQGKGVVLYTRKMMGITDPLKCELGTIRGDLSVDVGRNTVHGSDSTDSAKDEISLWFSEKDVFGWVPCYENIIYEK